MRHLALPCAALLLGGLACQKPLMTPPPTWEQQVTAATNDRLGQLRLEAPAHEGYRGGFSHGASMIHQAVLEDRTPFLPRPDLAPDAPPLQGALPPGIAIEAGPLRVEMDAATGMPFAPMLGSGDDTWKRGVQDGFAWALDRDRIPMEQRGLIRSLKAPLLPPADAWKPWPELRGERLLFGERNDRIRVWRTDLLAWRCDERGFPPTRSWRALTPSLRFHHAAAFGGLLWLDTYGGQTVAIDPGTGLLRAVLPGVHPVPTAVRGVSAWAAQWRENTSAMLERWGVDGEALQRAAEKGDAMARLKLAFRVLSSRPADASRLMQAAALQGFSQAQIALAMAYLEGSAGLPKDLGQAWIWLVEATGQQSQPAEEALKTFF